jgi:hypothetical protein
MRSIVLDLQAIERDTRDLMLFFTAGITALTLVIDGTLAKPLLSRLGMDRSITAETEVTVTKTVTALTVFHLMPCYCAEFTCLCCVTVLQSACAHWSSLAV